MTLSRHWMRRFFSLSGLSIWSISPGTIVKTVTQKRRVKQHIREVEKPNDWTSVLLAWAGFVDSLDLA